MSSRILSAVIALIVTAGQAEASQESNEASIKKMFMVPITRRSVSMPITLTQQYITEYHVNSIIAEANGEDFEPKHFSETVLDLSRGNELEKKLNDTVKFNDGAALEEGPDDSTISFIDLANQLNLAYTGPVFFGTPLQGSIDSEFVYDTGSGYLTTTSSDCLGCDSQYYDAETSLSNKKIDEEPKVLRYGSATVFGSVSYDRVCLA